jgi:hypothetical protein
LVPWPANRIQPQTSETRADAQGEEPREEQVRWTSIVQSQNLEFLQSLPTIHKVEEKRENFSLRKPRKPGEREKEKHFVFFFFEISHTKRDKTLL